MTMAGIGNGSILVVDDNVDNLRLLNRLLSEHGYKVRSASNGAHALATIQKEAPDLVLLDILMPEMDGFELCKHLKKDDASVGIPVIFISSLNAGGDIVKAFSLGGVDYVTKPFKEEEVLSRVKTHLSVHFLQLQVEKKNIELQKALDEIKTLQGILPICSSCKKIRNDSGYWQHIESYICDHSEAEFSHGLCDECAEELYPDIFSPKVATLG